MEFRTKVELPLKGPEIHHADQLMMWGSCFSEHIGNLLSENKFTCDVNPFGVLYNPISIASSIQRLLDGLPYQKQDLHQEQGQWYSLMHHSSFSSADVTECLDKSINASCPVTSTCFMPTGLSSHGAPHLSIPGKKMEKS